MSTVKISDSGGREALVTNNGLQVAIIDANGDQIASFGGGTQYTEGDTDATITGTATMMEVAANTLQPIQGTVADGLLVNLGANNDVTVAGVATAANQATIIGHVDGIEGLLTTIDSDTGNISTKIDTIAGAVSGTEMQVDVLTLPAITGTVTANAGTDLNTSLLALESGGNLASIKAKTDNIPPLGQALAAASTPVVLTAAQITTLTPPAAITGYATSAAQTDKSQFTKLTDGTDTALITASGELNVLASAQPGVDIGDVTINNASGGSAVNVQDGGNSLTVDNGGTFAVQVDGSALTALQLIDDVVYVDDTATHSTGTTKGVGMMAVANPTDAAIDANDIGMLAMTLARALKIDLTTVAGTAIDTNNGNKSAGTPRVVIATDQPQFTAPLNVTIQAGATGGDTVYHLVSAGTTNTTNIKASAGKVTGWYIYNSNAAARKLVFHDTAGTPTAGASVYFSLMIPPSSGANVSFPDGINFGTGIGISTVTGLADNDSAAVAANDLIINIFYK